MGWRRSLLARLGVGLAGGAALAVASCGEAGDSPGEDEGDEAEVVETTGDTGEGRSAIVGGQLEPGRSAVVALVRVDDFGGNHQLVCSGVLITPTIVVTAAHCVHPHVTGFAPEELTVVFGPDMATGERRNVLSGAYSTTFRVEDPGAEADIGALRLAGAAPVDPIAIGPAPTEGGSVVLVGYGSTSAEAVAPEDGSGYKRSGEALVGEVSERSFRVERAPSTTCSGDSGGATLADIGGAEVLIGIHSRGDCATELWNERVDAHANGFLKGFLGQYGGCNADGACAMSCPDPDPDCPCTADGTCEAACAPGEDPDCEDEDTCEEPAPDGTCCDDGACVAAAPISGGTWGSAGCAVARGEPSSGTRSLGALGALALAGLSLGRRWARRWSLRSAFRRRSVRRSLPR